MSNSDRSTLASDGDALRALAWDALLSAADWARGEQDLQGGEVFGVEAGRLCRVSNADSRALMVWQGSDGWAPAACAPPAVRALLDLYLPIASASSRSPLTVGHLGQSLDGYIATDSGDSVYVTGPQNILHLHRMRALCDAVMVGAETVANDDPRLTARQAAGDNPVRIILDPHRRLSSTHRVFSDRQAPTLLVCAEQRASTANERIGAADVLGVPFRSGSFDLEALMNALYARGMVSIFVEGGGHTVSALLEADLLDRLQVAVAPLMTGAGRPGIQLPERQRLKDCLRPPHRIFSMGHDVLFDFDLRGIADADGGASHDGLSRIV
jgi:riboflavin-specific deaminase-like protein